MFLLGRVYIQIRNWMNPSKLSDRLLLPAEWNKQIVSHSSHPFVLTAQKNTPLFSGALQILCCFRNFFHPVRLNWMGFEMILGDLSQWHWVSGQHDCKALRKTTVWTGGGRRFDRRNQKITGSAHDVYAPNNLFTTRKMSWHFEHVPQTSLIPVTASVCHWV